MPANTKRRDSCAVSKIPLTNIMLVSKAFTGPMAKVHARAASSPESNGAALRALSQSP